MNVAMEDCFVNLAVFFNILWSKVTTTTEPRMLAAPLAYGKRQCAKHLIKPHRVRQAERILHLNCSQAALTAEKS